MTISRVWWPSRKRCWWQGRAMDSSTPPSEPSAQPSTAEGTLCFTSPGAMTHRARDGMGWDGMRLSIQDFTKNLSATLQLHQKMQPVGFGRGHFRECFTGSQGSQGRFQSPGQLSDRKTGGDDYWTLVERERKKERKWECSFLLRTHSSETWPLFNFPMIQMVFLKAALFPMT